LTSFGKIKKTRDPVIAAKLNSKAQLPFFLFFEPFRIHLASKFAISANMTEKDVFNHNGVKSKNFMLI
jgi:hypothetical protein